MQKSMVIASQICPLPGAGFRVHTKKYAEVNGDCIIQFCPLPGAGFRVHMGARAAPCAMGRPSGPGAPGAPGVGSGNETNGRPAQHIVGGVRLNQLPLALDKAFWRNRAIGIHSAC